MSSIEEQIQALLEQAEALKVMGAAEQELEAATEAYREDPTEENKAAYRKANEDMAAARAASRADRPLGVGGDAFVLEVPVEETEDED